MKEKEKEEGSGEAESEWRARRMEERGRADEGEVGGEK